MDGILILLGLFVLFRVLARKGRTAANTAKQNTEDDSVKRSGMAPQSTSFHKYPTAPFTTEQKRKATQKQEPAYALPTQRLENVQRQTITTSLLKDVMRDAYSGSLNATASEGTASQEGETFTQGMASKEGTDTREPVSGLTQIGIPLSSAHPAQATEEHGILPVSWSGQELVRSFVVSEILGKPGKWSDYHG
jgi:hypothetical protein